MHSKIMEDILDWMGSVDGRIPDVRVGVVDDDSPLAVKLGDSDVAQLASTIVDVVVGDVVHVLQRPNSPPIILGRTAPEVRAQPGFHAYHTHGAGAYADSATIVMGNEVYDDLGVYSGGVFTAPEDSRWHFDLAIYRATTMAAGKYWQARIETSSGRIAFGELHIPPDTHLAVSGRSRDFDLLAGETVRAKIGTDGGTAAIYSANQSSFFTGHRIARL